MFVSVRLCHRVLIAGLRPGQSYTFVVHAENGVSDQSGDDRPSQRITVSTYPAGEKHIVCLVTSNV